jgi:hypothetical protein
MITLTGDYIKQISYFDISTIDHVERHGVEDEGVEDLAKDLAVPDPLVEVLLRHLLQQVGDELESLVLQLNIPLFVNDINLRDYIK